MFQVRDSVLRCALLAVIGLPGCAAAARPPEPSDGVGETGTASYISAALAGARTASGARFDPGEMVAAHRTLPFGTRVRVTNLGNGRHAVVTVVDRGPFRRGRILDVSPRAARTLGFFGAGVARVRIEILSGPATAGDDPR